jgi:shikimate kinase
MVDTRRLALASTAVFVLLSATGATFSFMLFKGQAVLDSAIVTASDHVPKVRDGRISISHSQMANLLEASIQVERGMLEMTHAAARTFAVCSILGLPCTPANYWLQATAGGLGGDGPARQAFARRSLAGALG